jgi:hypothetical protein
MIYNGRDDLHKMNFGLELIMRKMTMFLRNRGDSVEILVEPIKRKNYLKISNVSWKKM